jgi:P27 family predicted phage terminase small subunit
LIDARQETNTDGSAPGAGTLRKARHLRDRAGEAIAEGGLDRPPAGLTAAQRGAWRYTLQNAPAGVLKKIDRGLLCVWTEAETRHRLATKLMGEELVVMTEAGPVPSPYIAIIDKAGRTMLRAAAELGFSPSSRTRVRVEPPAKAADPADAWALLRLIPGGRTGQEGACAKEPPSPA